MCLLLLIDLFSITLIPSLISSTNGGFFLFQEIRFSSISYYSFMLAFCRASPKGIVFHVVFSEEGIFLVPQNCLSIVLLHLFPSVVSDLKVRCH